MLDDIKKDAQVRMAKCVQTFQTDMKKLRTGRAHPSLIEHLKVDYYGNDTPLNQVANIAVEDGRTLVVSPWEKAMVQPIEKAIHKSDLGLTPMTAGTVIRIPMPALTEEREPTNARRRLGVQERAPRVFDRAGSLRCRFIQQRRHVLAELVERA